MANLKKIVKCTPAQYAAWKAAGTLDPDILYITKVQDKPSGMENPMTTQGDLIVGGSNGTPTRLGIGQAGKFLKVNSAGTGYEFGDAGGGGGGGSTRYDHHIWIQFDGPSTIQSGLSFSGTVYATITTNSATEMTFSDLTQYLAETVGGMPIMATGNAKGAAQETGVVTSIDGPEEGALDVCMVIDGEENLSTIDESYVVGFDDAVVAVP